MHRVMEAQEVGCSCALTICELIPLQKSAFLHASQYGDESSTQVVQLFQIPFIVETNRVYELLYAVALFRGLGLATLQTCQFPLRLDSEMSHNEIDIVCLR